MVVGASAYLTQGQVRLTRMQDQLTTELGRHLDLEAHVATFVGPSNVLSQAQRNGLDAPKSVTDLPQVIPSAPSALSSPTTAPAPVVGPAPVRPARGR
jgi:hypothetical protein